MRRSLLLFGILAIAAALATSQPSHRTPDAPDPRPVPIPEGSATPPSAPVVAYRAVARPIDGLVPWGAIAAKSLRTVWTHGGTLSLTAPGLAFDTHGISITTGWYAYDLPWHDITDVYCVPTTDTGNPMTLAIATTDGGLIVLSDLALPDPIGIAEAAGAAWTSALRIPWEPGNASAACTPDGSAG